MRSNRTSGTCLAFATLIALGCHADSPLPAPPQPSDHPSLVWYAETEGGEVIGSRRPDDPVNPASVVKIATTWHALQELGPQYRFETRFALSGGLELETGVLHGDLLVFGDGDPDFHVENAYLVAQKLNEAGLRVVDGDLLVDDGFWIGWEGGSERRLRDPRRRAERMAGRLADALDPARREKVLDSLEEMAQRRSISLDRSVGVEIRGSARRLEGKRESRTILRHRSNPLHRTLKRFNGFSNNDIERLEHHLGSAAKLAAALSGRWELPADRVRLATLSGLGANRMTPRDVVRLLRELHEVCEAHGIRIEDVLPVGGCDPGTLEGYPTLTEGVSAGAVVAKTGTLTTTDGGVAVLAGSARTRNAEMLFLVAAPSSGKRLPKARQEEEAWLTQLVRSRGGAVRRPCGAALGFSDDDIRLLGPDPGS